MSYGMLKDVRITIDIEGHGRYETCANHLSDAMKLYQGRSEEDLQNILIWTQEGELDSVKDFVRYRAIKDRFHLLVMICSLSAEEPYSDYTIRERELPTEADITRYMNHLINSAADRLN